MPTPENNNVLVKFQVTMNGPVVLSREESDHIRPNFKVNGVLMPVESIAYSIDCGYEVVLPPLTLSQVNCIVDELLARTPVK